MQNLIRITVEPHVGVYLRVHYGDRMSLADKNFITSSLLHLFEPFDKVDPFLLKGQRKESLGDYFDVYMSDNMLKKYGGHLSNGSIQAFNTSVDLVIKQDMYRWCHHPNADHTQVDYNIKRFIDFYNFAEDDLTFDNLKRWYYRERERIKRRKVDYPEPNLIIPNMITHLQAHTEVQQLQMF